MLMKNKTQQYTVRATSHNFLDLNRLPAILKKFPLQHNNRLELHTTIVFEQP